MTSLAALVLAATVLHGLLAGATVDRGVVGMPAWRRLDVRAWAAYSRQADLKNGRFVYPVLAIGGALLSVAAALVFHSDVSPPRSAAVPVYAAVALAVGGLLATIGAAPKMLGLRRIGDDPVALQEAFRGFVRWSALRGLFQVLAFGANLWALVAVLGRTRG